MIISNIKRDLFQAERGEAFMAEETIQPVQEAPVPEAPTPEVPTGAPETPEAPQTKRKGSPLLVVLTVLLVLVGITDLILWGVAGYYLLRSF